MKKNSLILFVLLLGVNFLNANPVDREKAQLVAQKFAAAKFSSQQKSNDLQLVYTGVANRHADCFYVYNVGQEGFVIVSADDRFRPIVGYSDEGPFETDNMSPEFAFYLDKIIEARTSRNAVVEASTPDEWASVMATGKLLSRNRGRGVDYICQTLWNQDAPYNLYAPQATGGPGDRCYAGCVATAMSQVMKRWDYPTKGTGSHYYYCYDYGRLEANFGATNYNWDKMPNRLNGATQEEIEAVALLMYHCAVAVDMNFSPNGSGANSWDVPSAIQRYFSYSNQANLMTRQEYSLAGWQDLLKEQFDLGWPVYYSGFSESGGHAFVCDGYDDNDLFHYNFGWGGSGDGWFVIDEIDYASWAQAVINFVPSDVYTYMPLQPENLTIETSNDFDYAATLNWTNPTQNIHLNNLTSIDQIVITRNGKVIHTIENAAPGANMSYTDHYMSAVVNYSVYAVCHNAKGLETFENDVFLGPSCFWTVEMTSSESDGWRDGALSFISTEGKELTCVAPESSRGTQTVRLPYGHVDIQWKAPIQPEPVVQMSFTVKDAMNQQVVAFEGTSEDLHSGLFFIANNTCDHTAMSLNGPQNLSVNHSGNEVTLTWDALPDRDVYHYQIFRDNLLYALSDTLRFSFIEDDESFHNYSVAALTEVGETHPSNYCNVQTETTYPAPTNLRYEMVTPTKVKLSWDAPEGEGLRGYMVYRRTKGEDMKRIKLLTGTTHTDNLTSRDDAHYEYFVTAAYTSNYQSGFASSQDNPELHFVEVNKTIIPQQLTFTLDEGHVVLHWEGGTVATSYNIYRNGEPIAQGVTETDFIDHDSLESQVYHYYVTGSNDFLESSPSNEIVVDWTTGIPESDNLQAIQLYPNPTNGILIVEMFTETTTQPVTCRIFNLMGQEVMRQNLHTDKTIIDLSSLPDGTYFVKMAATHESKTFKVVKIQ